MRSKHLMPEMKEGGVNVTPLIDIVMCLIIFFMLMTKIGVATGADQTIETPETILGVSIKDLGSTLTLNVRGGPRLEEPIVTALVQKGDMEPREIRIVERRGATVDKPLERVLTDFKTTYPNAQVIIRGEKELQYHLLEQVLISCANARITNVNFQTTKAL
ncbi:MAG TPA: biopolymer transporter ExbD [Tepidisphaeraceae bacterium]|nr:biopolymer transporter ExbD [Tepidisphaeraceae bacterium]